MKTIRNITTLLTAAVTLGAASAGAQGLLYLNDFTETADTLVTTDNAFSYLDQVPWSLNTSGSGTLNMAATTHPTSTATANVLEPGNGGSASVQLPGWGGQDFTISSTFTLTNPGGLDSGSRAFVFGFAFLGSEANFVGASFYRAEINISADGQNFGQISLSRQGGGSFATAGANANVAAFVGQGATIELRVTGTHVGGSLFMDVGVYNTSGTLLGARGTAEDTSPLTGEHFGFRVRAPGGGNSSDRDIDIDIHDFSVIPEPSTVALMFGGVVLAMALVVRRRCRA